MNRDLLKRIRLLSGDRCDYCRMPRHSDPLPFQTDHVIARQHGGDTVLENLAWCCLHCNKYKGPNIAGIDPLSGDVVRLFHPRKQNWSRHFQWSGATLLGLTKVARATIRVLAINDPDFMAFRAELMEEGIYES